MLLDLGEAVVELVVRDGLGGFAWYRLVVEFGHELLCVFLAHVLQRPDEDYVEEARERVVEEVDALARVRAFDAVPVVDCDF